MSTYLHLDGEQKGPFTNQQLREMWRSGVITSETLYWRDGFSEWQSLAEIIEELEPQAGPPSIQKQQNQAIPNPKKKKKGGCLKLFAWVILSLVGLSIISALFIDSDTSGSERNVPQSEQNVPAQLPVFDIAAVSPNELPATTQTKSEIVVPIAGGSGSATAASGTTVNVLGLTGGQVEVEYLGGKVAVPYLETTIEEQIARSREAAAQEQAIRQQREAQAAAEKEKAEKEARKSRSISLYAVRNSDGTITVENRDDFDWTDIRLYLNNSYETRINRISARSSVRISSNEFTKKDGTRFNPFSIKPQALVITADTPLGRTPSEANWR